MLDKQIISETDRYYTNRFKEHQRGPLAADWNSKEAQEIRFDMLSKIIRNEQDKSFSICDYGCGLGDYYSYICSRYKNVQYTGIDISSDIIDQARKEKQANFVCDSIIREKYDYIIASGIFNVRQKVSDEDWLNYIIDTITMFAESANTGFAFNCLTSYSDEEHKKDYLYYADPCFLFDYCKKHFSRNVAILHDYDIYDFTILVRRDNTWLGGE